MELFPAIDLIDGCAVRLVKGDYAQKTIYSENPPQWRAPLRRQGEISPVVV